MSSCGTRPSKRRWSGTAVVATIARPWPGELAECGNMRAPCHGDGGGCDGAAFFLKVGRLAGGRDGRDRPGRAAQVPILSRTRHPIGVTEGASGELGTFR